MRHHARHCTSQSYANAMPASDAPPRQSDAHGRKANVIEEEHSTCHSLAHRAERRRSMWLAGRPAAAPAARHATTQGGAKGDS